MQYNADGPPPAARAGRKYLAVAIVPPGNVVRVIREAKTEAFRSGGSPDALALPEAIFLGFFAYPRSSCHSDDRPVGMRTLKKRFAASAPKLFTTFPPRLVSGTMREFDGMLFACPGDGYDAHSAAAAGLEVGTLCGLEALEEPPFAPGEGFLFAKDVSIEAVPVFSFGGMDAVLYSFRSGREPSSALVWTELARVARKTGPRAIVQPS